MVPSLVIALWLAAVAVGPIVLPALTKALFHRGWIGREWTHDRLRVRVDEYDGARLSPAIGRALLVFALGDVATVIGIVAAVLLRLPPIALLLLGAVFAAGCAVGGAGALWAALRLSAWLDADAGGVAIRRLWPRASWRARWADVDRVEAQRGRVAFVQRERTDYLYLPAVDRRVVERLAAELENARARGVPDPPPPNELKAVLRRVRLLR